MTNVDLMNEYLNKTLVSLEICRENIQEILPVIDSIVKSLQNGKKIFFCGNGGSAAQSQHLAAEFCGRFLMERPSLPAISLTTDTSALTAIANDYGYDAVFSRQVAALGNQGDVLIGISTSGKSANVIEAMKVANSKKMTSVALVGPERTEMSHSATFSIHCHGEATNFIREQQFVLGHMICYLSERNINKK